MTDAERDALRAENERLSGEKLWLADRLLLAEAENERLKVQHGNDMHTIDVGSRANAGLEIEIERLRALIVEHHSTDVSRIPAGGLCPICPFTEDEVDAAAEALDTLPWQSGPTF